MSFKDTLIKFKDSASEKIASQFDDTKDAIKTDKELKEFIKLSKNTSFKSEKTGETRKFTKHVIVIFIGKENKLGVSYKVLKTKVWASNAKIKLAQLPLKDVKTTYKATKFPALALWTNQKLVKTIIGEEKIKKLAKGFNVDIIKEIEETE